MLNTPRRRVSVFLSPGVSILIALVGGVLIALRGGAAWPLTLGASAVVAALMVFTIKARMLFHGPNFPFAAFFLLLQAQAPQSLSGNLLVLFAAGMMFAAFLCFMRRDCTRLIFTLALLCGAGALWFRPFGLMVAAILVIFLTVRALSLRGFVAALLGVLTAAILLFAVRAVVPVQVAAVYSGGWFCLPDFSVAGILPAVITLLAVNIFVGLGMFLPSYGYPAKQRARNMAMLMLSLCAVVMLCVDYANAVAYLPLLGLCGAYQLSHLVATRPYGWIISIIVWLIFVAVDVIPF